MPQAIRGYFGDGEALGLRMDYSVEEQPLGTAGSVRSRAASSRTRSSSSRETRSATSTSTLVEAHKERKAAVTIGLKSVENPLEFGIVVTDDDGRVERFLEKPSWGQVFSDTINTGIYVIEPKRFGTCRPTDPTTSRRSCSLCCWRWAARSTGT